MKCPRCGLINLDTAYRCDCGYDFRINELDPRYAKPVPKVERRKELAVRVVTVGLIILILWLLPSSSRAYLTFSKVLWALGLALIVFVAGYFLFRLARKGL